MNGKEGNDLWEENMQHFVAKVREMHRVEKVVLLFVEVAEVHSNNLL